METAPPPISKENKKRSSKSIFIISGIIFGVIGFLVVIAVLGIGIIWGIKSVSGNVVSGEAKSSLQSDYSAWKNALSSYADFGEKKEEAEGSKVGMAAKMFSLPSDSSMKSFFKKRLPDGVRIKNFEAVAYEKNDDELTIHYKVELQSKEPFYIVKAGAFSFEDKKNVKMQKIAKHLILAGDLPSGFSYDANTSKEVVPSGKTVKFIWTVERISKIDGEWNVMKAEAIPFVRNPQFENKFLQENIAPQLMRTEEELASAAARKETALKEVASRLEMIQQQVAKFREEAFSDVPGRPIDRKGGSGSGTPTKAGMGMVSGAAAGAGLGAIAGGGDGAAIGAGAGAAAGLLGGYLWGRSDEEDALAAKRSARARAKRAAEKRIAAYEDQLWQEFEQELAAKAKEHDASLAKAD